MGKAGRGGLGLRDRLVLLVAWVVTCGLVYLLGVYLGKGVQERRLGIEERVVRLPVTSRPPPEGQRPKAESELTFYDTLVPGERREPPAQHDTPPGAGASVAATPAPRPAPAAAASAGRPGAPASIAPSAASPDRPAAHAAVPGTQHAAPPARAATRPAQVPALPAAAPGTPRPAVAGGPALPAAARPSGGGWTVQANPTRSREEAESLLRQLRGRGYDAAVVQVQRDGDTWYRVRVGRFASAEQATEVMQRLREREGVLHVFVASE